MRTIQRGSEAAGAGAVAALGVFDGVHLGHRALFREASALRGDAGLPVVAVTFHPHPRTLTGQPDGYDRLLTPPDEKSALIEDESADYLMSVPFTRELASTPPLEFARSFLAGELQARRVVCGFNFTFGYRGAGTPEDLVRWGKDLGFSVTVVPPCEAGGEIVSSTRIRAALAEGDVAGAALCLGRPYCLAGRVTPGDGRGRRIGIPTSNVEIPDGKIVPGNGVYAALARVAVSPGGIAVPRSWKRVLIREHLAVVNVGTRPTFGGEGVRVEAHIPGFDGVLYGQTIQVFFLGRLRDEQEFPGALALRAQVEEDVGEAQAAFGAGLSRDRVLSRGGAAPGGAPGQGASFTMPGAYDRMLASSLP